MLDSLTIAIIPARGGSKRIPGKNIKHFLGKPIMAYALAAALDSHLFDHVVVSTDDEEIAKVAIALGADVPFKRPAVLADDFATTDQVIFHALSECERHYGPIKRGCCIYPASPFLTPQLLAQGQACLERFNASAAYPVVEYEAPIQQALRIVDSRPVMLYPEAVDKRSQDLESHFHDAGMFYWFDVDRFRNADGLNSPNTFVFTIDKRCSQDINTPQDWRDAEIKYRLLTSETSS